MSQADWRMLPALISSPEKHSMAARVLVRALELLDLGEVRFGVVEAITALEIAVDQRFRLAVGAKIEKAQTFFQLPLPSRVVACCIREDGSLLEGADAALDLIAVRNAVVHDGADVPAGAEKLARATLAFTRELLGPERPRLPSAGGGNLLVADPAQWGSRYGN